MSSSWFKEISWTCFTRNLNKICWSVGREEARFVCDGFAAVRSLVTPLLAVSVLLVKMTGCAGKVFWIGRDVLAFTFAFLVLSLAELAKLPFAVFPHTKDCINHHGHHSNGWQKVVPICSSHEWAGVIPRKQTPLCRVLGAGPRDTALVRAQEARTPLMLSDSGSLPCEM